MTDKDKLKYLHEHQKDMDRDDYKTYWHWYRTKLLAEVMLDQLYDKINGEVKK